MTTAQQIILAQETFEDACDAHDVLSEDFPNAYAAWDFAINMLAPNEGNSVDDYHSAFNIEYDALVWLARYRSVK